VATHDDRHRRDQEPARRRGDDARSRKPEILADAAYHIFHKPNSFTGNFLIDDTFLAGEGIPTSTNIASTPASRCRWISLCPTPCRRPKASA